MPRGVPKSGFRKTKNRIARMSIDSAVNGPLDVITRESDEEIEAKLTDRFDILDDMTIGAMSGDIKALIVSGPAGLGKSYTVESRLNEIDDTRKIVIRGLVNKTGLYKILYQYRHPGNVVVFDDADRIFFDDDSLNMLKAVCDTMKERRLSYLSEYKLVDEESAEVIPKQFVFEGTIIFITNFDFDDLITRGHKIAPHLSALVSRSHYIDLAMKTKRDYLIRIRQVVKMGMLQDIGLNDKQQNEVMKFIDDNKDSLRELSLRVAIKIGTLAKTRPDKWAAMARVTCCRNQ
jgi:hypothetical protein|tara:strand:- start:3548 stop:4417 length:870 start_codon:yes stop_codon:yes gene_type:complete